MVIYGGGGVGRVATDMKSKWKTHPVVRRPRLSPEY